MDRYEAIVVGAGPAGSTAAALLASKGVRTLLLEEKRMPREKVCGEFITPECFPTLDRLRVFNQVLQSGARKISRVTLSAPGKTAVGADVKDISGAECALGVSRSRFDHILFNRAAESGARCLEGIAVKQCLYDANSDSPSGVQCLSLDSGHRIDFKAPIIIDASGRGSRLMVERNERPSGPRGSRRYAMKVHLSGVDSADGRVQLFFFPNGYGGLSPVEDGLANLCFITSDKNLHEAGGDPEKVLRNSIFLDGNARDQLAGAQVEGKWQTVGPLAFGTRRLHRAGVLAAGDSAGMIDPFTGTGIQVALRSGELLAQAILEQLGPAAGSGTADQARLRVRAYLDRVGKHSSSSQTKDRSGLIDSIRASYETLYFDEFGRRMRVAGLLRRVAFSETGRSLAAAMFSAAPWLTRWILRATRPV